MLDHVSVRRYGYVVWTFQRSFQANLKYMFPRTCHVVEVRKVQAIALMRSCAISRCFPATCPTLRRHDLPVATAQLQIYKCTYVMNSFLSSILLHYCTCTYNYVIQQLRLRIIGVALFLLRLAFAMPKPRLMNPAIYNQLSMQTSGWSKITHYYRTGKDSNSRLCTTISMELYIPPQQHIHDSATTDTL